MFKQRYTLLTLAGLILTTLAPLLAVLSSRVESEFGIGNKGLGLLFGLPSLGSLAGTLAAGALSHRLGAARTVRLSLLTAASGAMCCAAGHQFIVFCLGQLLFGLGSGMLWVSGLSFLNSVHPDKRRRVISLSFLCISVGAVNPLLWNALARWPRTSSGLSYLVVFHSSYLILAGSLIALHFALRGACAALGGSKQNASRAAAGAKPSRRDYRIALFFILALLHGGADSAIYLWMPKYLEETFRVRPFAPAWVLTLHMSVYVVCRFLLAALPEKGVKKSFLVLPGIVGGLILALGLLSHNYVVAALAEPAGAFFWGIEVIVLMALAASMFSHHDAAAFALINCGMYLGSALFPLAIGWITDQGIPLRHAMLLCPAGFITFGVVSGLWALNEALWQTRSNADRQLAN